MKEAVPVLSNGGPVGNVTRMDPESLQEPLLTYEPDEEKRSDSSSEMENPETAKWDEMIGLTRKISGETIASFIVVFTLLAMKVNTDEWGDIATLATSLIGGLVVMVTIFSLGHVSGAHINPVVTIAYTFTRHFPIYLAPLYVLAHLLGGVLAALVLEVVYRPTKGLVLVTPESSVLQSFLAEMLAGFLLLFVASAVTTDTRAIGEFAGLAVGAIIAIDILVVGPVSGGGINPARALGPAIVYWEFPYIWIYVVGPIVGGLLGAALYKVLRPEMVWRRINYSLSSRDIRGRTPSVLSAR